MLEQKHTAPLTPEQIEAEISHIISTVDWFAEAMTTRLVQIVTEENRMGWDDPINAEDYYKKLLAHAAGVPMAAGQEVDIANFAMFLWRHRTMAGMTGGQS